ncbi:MAG: OprO/OprP family phosphate-selective porin [Gammaproteobacteria bacterium]
MRLKQIMIGAASAIAITSMSTAAFAGAVTSKEEIAVSTTGGGIKIQSDNGNTFQFGGRIMYDMDFYDGLYNSNFTDDNAGDNSSEAEFRRTRLEVKGSSGENWNYELAVDVDEGETRIQTGFITYKGLGFADVHLGRFKVPFGLEELGSSKWVTSIERSPTTELGFLFNIPSFSLGLTGHTDSLFWGASIVDEDNEDEAGKDAYSLAGRVGGHFNIGDNSFMHLAASYASRDFGDDGSQRFRTRLGVHTTERITVNNAERFGVDDADQFGLEAAGVFGPFSLQGEYREANYDEGNDIAATPGLNDAGQRVSDVDIEGYYLQASYLLTGESRVYKGEKGIFDKVKPKGPRGAWELVAKYEEGEVDVDVLGDQAEFELLTLGVNWYANNNLKFMLNYLDGDTDGFTSAAGDALNGSTNANVDDEDGSAISFRTQYVF